MSEEKLKKPLKASAEEWYEELETTVGLYKEAVERYNNPKYTTDGTTPEKMRSQDDSMITRLKEGIELITEAVIAENKDIAKKVLSKSVEVIELIVDSRPKYLKELDETKKDELASIVDGLKRQDGHIKILK